ncbi:RICIN domain-containing protein [Nonomuraea typhae]|uniref:RICIN domain-containing protein n=1 Tax=Nonomuraea typhae TaxID=2603600 RepID=A0ABW7YQJ8_9ACTN
MKRSIPALVLAACLLALMVATPAQAAAVPPTNPKNLVEDVTERTDALGLAEAVYVIHGKVNTAKCLDIEHQSTATRAPLTHWDCNNAANQEFRLKPFSAGGYNTYMIENVNSGKCLGVRVRDFFEPYPNQDRIEQDWCDPRWAARHWIPIVNGDDGSYTFCNLVHEITQERRCMDIPYSTTDNTKTVWVVDLNGGAAQRFFTQQK